MIACRLASEPSDRECMEAIASQGRACRKCDLDCYRRGWTKRAVDADNRRRCSRPAPGGGEGDGE